MVYVTSDWHFGHNREFVYGPRGFPSIEDHDRAIIERHNALVTPFDRVYVLGDLMLGGAEGFEHGIECLKQMRGNITVIRGNHDTDKRVAAYRELGWEVFDALRLEYNKYHFYLSHYPTITSNLEKESLRQCTINLYGHTHQQTNFYQDIPFIYHVGVDSHCCYPVRLDNIIVEMKAKTQECKDLI